MASIDIFLSHSFTGGLGESVTDKKYPLTPLQQAWKDWLAEYPYEWFVTFTFRKETHPEAADKSFRKFINILNKEIYGRHYFKNKKEQVHWIRALEWQKREVVHYHALLVGVTYESRSKWSQEWYKLAGFAKIDTVDSQNVIDYLCKYVSKGGEIDISPYFHLVKQLPQVD